MANIAAKWTTPYRIFGYVSISSPLMDVLIMNDNHEMSMKELKREPKSRADCINQGT
jgi:hypothetical protein